MVYIGCIKREAVISSCVEMPTAQISPCIECTRLRARYASASGKREWAKSDLIAAVSSHDADAVKTAQLAKEEAVHQWERAVAELEAHLKTH